MIKVIVHIGIKLFLTVGVIIGSFFTFDPRPQATIDALKYIWTNP